MSSAGASFVLPVPDIAHWRTGNVGTPGVWQFDSGAPGRHVMITALVHGNELCGAWALKGLLEAGIRPRRGKLTLAFCNLGAFDRFDPADHDASRYVDEDMNRQWSPERLADPRSAERRRAAELVPFVRSADWLLDLHSMHEPSAPLSLTGLAPANLALARRMGAPQHIVVDAGHADGVRMRDFGRFGNPATSGQSPEGDVRSLLVECGYHGATESRDVAQDQCLRFLEQSGTMASAELAARLPGWRMPDPPWQQVLEVTGAVVAKSTGFAFVDDYRGLELIPRAGTVIAHDDGPVMTPHDNCVLVMPSVRQARPGVTVARFAHAWRLGGVDQFAAGL